MTSDEADKALEQFEEDANRSTIKLLIVFKPSADYEPTSFNVTEPVKKEIKKIVVRTKKSKDSLF